MGKVKIFLSYHKKTPLFKSEQFEPISVGNYSDDNIISDKTGVSISELNPYYCELTGQYWVLKNYIDNCEEEYIGFAHYRRLPDLMNIKDEDIPSIFGMKYSDSIDFFKKLNSANLYEYCKEYDAIYPCTCYMYKNTVNPALRENEQVYNVYEHFKAEHNNNCLDILKIVIDKYYPEYSNSISKVFKNEKSLFYNIYIMKKELIRGYLTWLFDILEKIGDVVKEEEEFQDKYKRMAGFVAETLTNVWLDYHESLKTGHCPIFMIDFESELIEKANRYNAEGNYNSEITELEKLYELTSDKFNVLLATANAYINLDKKSEAEITLKKAESFAKTSENFHTLAKSYIKNGISSPDNIIALFETAIKLSPDEKFYPKSLLLYTEKLHDINKTSIAWEYMKNFDMTETETEKYNQFLKVVSMLKG